MILMLEIIDLVQYSNLEDFFSVIEKMYEDSPHGIIVLKEDQVLFTNKQLTKITGYSSEEFLEWNLQDCLNIITEDTVEIPKTNAEKKLIQKEDLFTKYKIKYRSASGEIKPIQVFSKPIEINRERYLFVVLHDIPEEYDGSDVEKTINKLIQNLENLDNNDLDLIELIAFAVLRIIASGKKLNYIESKSMEIIEKIKTIKVKRKFKK